MEDCSIYLNTPISTEKSEIYHMVRIQRR